MMPRSPEELQLIARFADALPAAIWVGRAPSGECVYVNEAFNQILGITPPEDAARGNYVGPYGVHRSDGQPYPEADMPFERVMRAHGPVVVDDLVIHRHDGQRTHLRVFASPLMNGAGEISYVVEAFTDISREVVQEQARREADRKLQIAQRLDAVGSLAGGVAHDFNNLLSVVKLVAGQLAVTETDPQRVELIRYLDHVADSAAALTQSLLGFAQRGRVVARPVDLNQLARAAVELGRRTFGSRLVVEAELCAQPVIIDGDRVQIEQVFMNLLMNARDALAGGSGRIVVRTFRQPAHDDGEQVVLEVQDNGPGLDPSVRDRVFEPYVTTKVAGPTKGTGLGLATVYGIAKSHGGAAEVASTGPGGTVMRVSFRAGALPATAEVVETQPAQAPRGDGTILVVDDEPLVLRAAVLTLEHLGYRAVPAVSGDAAVTALREQRDQVRGVLLDVTMPGLSAPDTYRALRAVKPGLPVFVMTGAATSDDARQLRDLGVAGFLEKPFDAHQLGRMLGAALTRSA